MTVKELIEELKQVKQDSPVFVCILDGKDYFDGFSSSARFVTTSGTGGGEIVIINGGGEI